MAPIQPCAADAQWDSRGLRLWLASPARSCLQKLNGLQLIGRAALITLPACCKPTATGAAPTTFKTHPGHFPLRLHGAKRAAASFMQPSCGAVTNYMW